MQNCAVKYVVIVFDIQGHLLLYTEEVFQTHTRKTQECLQYVHRLFYRWEKVHNNDNCPYEKPPSEQLIMCSIGGSSSEMNHSYTAINLQIINKLNGNSRLSIWHFARLSQNFNFAKPRSEDFWSTQYLVTKIPHPGWYNWFVKPIGFHSIVHDTTSIVLVVEDVFYSHSWKWLTYTSFNLLTP